MGWASNEEEMRPMDARPAASENAEKDPAEGDELRIIGFDKNFFSNVEVILVVQKNFGILHPLRTMNAEHSKGS